MTVPHSGYGWRLAPSLIAMEAEADRIAPRRRRSSDGSIGDRSHRNRASDHNPSGGYVHAFDLSHDPARGMDAHAHARNIAARRDPRIKYIITNRRIWSADRGWRAYSGANPHTLHAHFSVQPTSTGRFDTSPWFHASVVLPTKPVPPPIPGSNPEPEPEHDQPKGPSMDFLCRIKPEQAKSDHEKKAIWFGDGFKKKFVGLDENNSLVKGYAFMLIRSGQSGDVQLVNRDFAVSMREET